MTEEHLVEKKTRYYIDRLKIMSLAEISHRINERRVAAAEHKRLIKGKSEWNLIDLSKELILNNGHSSETTEQSHKNEQGVDGFEAGNGKAAKLVWQQFRAGKINPFYFDANNQTDLVNWYKKRYPNELTFVRQRANELCDHVIPIFGRQFNFPTTIPWHQDPITHKEWPQIYCADIDTKDGQTIGGVKWVWELNRHQHLVTLGKAFFLTGDERYAQEACSQICHWIETNTPLIGVNWVSSLELAVRVISWLWAIHFIQQSKALDESNFHTIFQSIYEQTRFIETHLSAFTSANNHLVGEAAGLASVGLVFPQLRRSREWIEKGIQILTEEIEKQLYPDGVSAEQSVHYGMFSVDFWIGILVLARKANIEVPRVWYERLDKAGEFMMYIIDSEGNVPQIGDDDGGCAYWLCESPDFNKSRSMLSTLAVLCKQGDFKYQGKWFDEKSFWMLGIEGCKVYEGLKTENNSSESREFSKGGYYILRSEETVLVFDCGKLGYTSHAGHGHADALSVTLSICGKPVLVDPGMPCYHENSQLRDAFRGTSAHNTIVVDRRNQSEIADTFLWLRKANARCDSWKTNRVFDSVVGMHDGYSGVGVLHQRQVTFVKPDTWVIIDTLRGTGAHQLEQYWHFAPDVEIHNVNEGSATIVIKDIVLDLIFTGPMNFSLRVVTEAENTANGWISPHYSKLIRAPVLCYHGIVKLPCSLTTLMIKREKMEVCETSK